MKTLALLGLIFLSGCSTIQWKTEKGTVCQYSAEEPISICRAEQFCRDNRNFIYKLFGRTYPQSCVESQLEQQKYIAEHQPPEEKYVSQIVYEEDFPKVIKARCEGKLDSNCAKILNDMLNAKYEIAYPYADWRVSTRWCKANPIECNFKTWQGAAEFEDQLIETHEKNKAQAHFDAQDRARAQAEFLDRQRRIEFANALSAMSAAFKTTNCVTTTTGGAAYTTCH